MQHLFAVIVLFIATLTVADIPVHCEIQQIVGKWTFSLGDAGHDSSLVHTCTIKTPSIPVTSYLNVSLSLPDIAVDDKNNTGTWTMIYDEALEVVINGKKFFAFFNFTTHWFVTKSHCDQTFTGTYHDAPQSPGAAPANWGCWRGSKVQSLEHYFEYTPEELPPVNDMKFHNDEAFLQQINSNQDLWTARAYPQFEGLSYAQMYQKGGRFMSQFKLNANKQHKKVMQQHVKRPNVNDLPTSFDWRNVNGVNFVSPVRNQEQCGSCYSFGTLGMYEARIRIKTNNTQQPILSPQNIVSCSTYSQGCEGGLELLVSKYGQDFGFVKEACEPYYGSDSKCNNKCPPEQVTRTTDYSFVGGYYGACSEEAMMQDLVTQGPVVVGFEVYDDFFNYSGGIYRHTGMSRTNKFITVNHAVLVVGYGVSGKTKFWIVKNSWGSSWGEQGYFKILKGVDECGIESEASVGAPVV